MRFTRILPAAILPLALLTKPALAQDAAECSVNTYQPKELAQAQISIQRASGAATPADAAKSLKDAMKSLRDDKKFTGNPAGQAFLLAQTYVIWLHQDGAKDVMTNDELGRSGPKTATVDLFAAADSLLDIVEAQGPACAQQTAAWRQSKPWTDKLNAAYQFLGANQLDSAEHYIQRAALLNMESAYVHNAMAQVALQKNDQPGMLAHLEKAIELGKADTTMTETRRQMQFQYAQAAQQLAMAEGTADKDALLKKAVDTYLELLKEMPEAKEAAYAFSAAAEIVSMRQDTAQAKGMLAMLSADPAPYDDLTLLLAADMARLLNLNDDAMKMYEAALVKNPNVRDANFFLAFMHYEKKDAAKMLPLTRKVVELDPSNPDNYQMLGEALRLSAAAEKDAAKKAALVKEAEQVMVTESGMQHRLTVSQFERRAEGAALSGAIENRGKAAKTYDVVFEFLDAQGNVVETMTANVANVAAGGSGTFQLTATKPGIVAYRYQAIK